MGIKLRCDHDKQAQGEKMSEEKVLTPQEYYKDFPEAPFSDSFKWLDAEGFEHIATIRSWSANSGMGAIESAKKIIVDIGGKPVNNLPKPLPESANKIPLTDENGTPVVDINRNPVMSALPDGVHVFTVAGFGHDRTKSSNKDVLKGWTQEKPYIKGYD